MQYYQQGAPWSELPLYAPPASDRGGARRV